MIFFIISFLFGLFLVLCVIPNSLVLLWLLVGFLSSFVLINPVEIFREKRGYLAIVWFSLFGFFSLLFAVIKLSMIRR
jgi:hypothetical protein